MVGLTHNASFTCQCGEPIVLKPDPDEALAHHRETGREYVALFRCQCGRSYCYTVGDLGAAVALLTPEAETWVEEKISAISQKGGKKSRAG